MIWEPLGCAGRGRRSQDFPQPPKVATSDRRMRKCRGRLVLKPPGRLVRETGRWRAGSPRSKRIPKAPPSLPGSKGLRRLADVGRSSIQPRSFQVGHCCFAGECLSPAEGDSWLETSVGFSQTVALIKQLRWSATIAGENWRTAKCPPAY